MGITYDRLLNWTASSMTVSNMNVNRDHRYDAEFDLSYEEKLSLINDKSEDEVQPIEWSWFCKEDFDIEWYEKFYGREQAKTLSDRLQQFGIYLF